MNKAFTAFFVILFLVSVQALSYNVKEQILANTAWTFSVTFDSFDFSEAKVLLNDEPLFSVFTYASNKTIIERYSSKVISAEMNSLTLSSSLAALNAGDYTLKILLYKNGSLLTEEAINFTVFNALPESFRQETQEQFNSVNKSINEISGNLSSQISTVNQSLSENISSLDSKINSVQTDLTERIANVDSKVNSLDNSLQETQSNLDKTNESLAALNSNLNKLNAEYKEIIAVQAKRIVDLENNLAAVKQELQAQAFKINHPYSTGFASIAGMNPVVSLLVLALIVILVLLFIGYKRFIDIERRKQEATEEQLGWRGKWAAFKQKESESKRFSLGDLIKK